jgi:hypothetical protein
MLIHVPGATLALMQLAANRKEFGPISSLGVQDRHSLITNACIALSGEGSTVHTLLRL